MDSTSIQLPDSEIEDISLVDGCLTVRFSRAYIVKTMTGSSQKTLWWQAGTLVIRGAEALDPLPSGPAVCAGGDVDENVYTYRDMIPIPLESRGRTGCHLRLKDGNDDADEVAIRVVGETIRLDMTDTPKYIRHIAD
ncbi:MAG: hypothetical protein K9L70_04775 [Thiohalocapsa sp.]|nr:hypothetical protein [Thiohalocapsa sp.]MCF7990224.1 hypothetical protein [Thiohalocapsa sp.]